MAKKPFTLAQHADPCPNLLIEHGPAGEGVGRWVPDEKHTLLAKMIGGTRGARAKYTNRVLIDPFCGPGRIQVKGESHTRDGGAIVACREASLHNVAFTHVFLGDLNSDRVDACVSRLHAIGMPAQGFAGPAAETVPRMMAVMPSRSLVLAYIDPYNLEFLSFDIIQALAKNDRVDFAVHFSTMDLQRNVDMELDATRARFDEAAPGWRQALAAVSKTELRVEFFRYWMGLIVKLGFAFSREMPLVRGDRNEPLYRLVFFSRHDFPNRIWDDVARGANMDFGF